MKPKVGSFWKFADPTVDSSVFQIMAHSKNDSTSPICLDNDTVSLYGDFDYGYDYVRKFKDGTYIPATKLEALLRGFRV